MPAAANFVDDVLSSLKTLGQKQQVNEQQNRPQTPRQTAFQGLIGGFLEGHKNAIDQARAEDDAVREQAIALINAIPDTPENRPLRIRMAMGILDAKPGQNKSWHDQLFRPQPDEDYRQQLFRQISSMIPSDEEQALQAQGQTVQGKVNLQGEDGNYVNLPPMYDSSKNAMILTRMNKKTGKYEFDTKEGVVSEKYAIAELKGQAGQNLPPHKRRQMAEAEILATQKYQKPLEALSPEQQEEMWVEAGKELGKIQEAIAKATQMKPELVQSQINSNNATLGGKQTNTRGLTNAQEIAKRDERVKEGQRIQSEIGEMVAELRGFEEDLKVKEADPMKEVSRTRSTALAEARRKVATLKEKIKNKAEILRGGGYGDLFNVEVGEDGTPKISLKTIAMGKEIVNKRPPAKVKQTTGSWESAIKENPPITGRGSEGDKNFAITDSFDMKGMGMMRHPMYGKDDGVYVLQRTGPYQEQRVGDSVEIAGKFYTVVYSTNKRLVVKLAE